MIFMRVEISGGLRDCRAGTKRLDSTQFDIFYTFILHFSLSFRGPPLLYEAHASWPLSKTASMAGCLKALMIDSTGLGRSVLYVQCLLMVNFFLTFFITFLFTFLINFSFIFFFNFFFYSFLRFLVNLVWALAIDPFSRLLCRRLITLGYHLIKSKQE